jgi:hypothetical protein
MNWGYKIFIVIIVFIVGMLSMVAVAMRQTNEMVDDKYYEKEIAYQGLIDASNNLKNITAASLIYQTDSTQNIADGSVQFLRLNNQKQDLNLALQPDNTGIQTLSKTKLIRGMYKIRVKWTSNSKPYYAEETVFVQK